MTRPIAYYAVVEQGEDGSASAWFPDVPGCVTAADPGEDIAAAAIEALNAHLELTDAQGVPRPAAQGPGDMLRDEDIVAALAAGGFFVRTPVIVASGSKAKRVNVSLTEDTLLMIDQAAKLRGLSRSAYITAAVSEHVARHAS